MPLPVPLPLPALVAGVLLCALSASAQAPEPWSSDAETETETEAEAEAEAEAGTGTGTGTGAGAGAGAGTELAPVPPPPLDLPPVPPPPADVPPPVQVPPPVPTVQPLQLQPIQARPRFGWKERFAPTRVPGHRFVLDVLPFVGEQTGGLLAIADWLYRSPSGVWSSVRVGPGGFAIEDGSRIGVFDASYSLGWEHRFFGFGFGVGVAYARIEDTTRRTQGMTPIGLAHIRGGAEEGIHIAGTIGATVVDGKPEPTTFRIRFRWPLSHRRYLDFELNGSGALSYAYGMVAFEMGLRRNRDSPWRIRPHVGFAEVIDAVRRVGGPGLSLGVALVYLTPPHQLEAN